MTLQQLRYVVMVADTGTITEAANRLYISQPSLTNAIHELEKETVDGWVAEAQNYLKNVAKATDKEINDMLNELYQNGYYDYKLGKSYEESFYKKYNEGGNN